MSKFHGLLILTLINCLSTGYFLGFGKTDDLAEIRKLQDVQRQAHLNRNANLLVSMFSPDFTNIGAGKIEKLTREQGIKRFQPYFDQSTFLEWDNISPPTIRVSKDGSMAYSIVHKRVRLKARDENGVEREFQTNFAWMETYEKQNGTWMLTAVASTNEPTQKK